jgi:hypothetical protein
VTTNPCCSLRPSSESSKSSPSDMSTPPRSISQPLGSERGDCALGERDGAVAGIGGDIFLVRAQIRRRDIAKRRKGHHWWRIADRVRLSQGWFICFAFFSVSRGEERVRDESLESRHESEYIEYMSDHQPGLKGKKVPVNVLLPTARLLPRFGLSACTRASLLLALIPACHRTEASLPLLHARVLHIRTFPS